MKITTTLFLILLSTSFAFSQRQEKIDSDRPGQSMSPHTVGKNVLQVQTGIDYSNNSSNPRYSFTELGNETNVRYGILNILEINGSIGYRLYNTNYIDNNIKDRTNHGAELLRVGTRVNIIDHDGLTPAIAASAELVIPYETDVYDFIDYGFRGTVVIKQPITKELSLTGNFGIYYTPQKLESIREYYYRYTLNTSYSFTDKLSAFAEIYGFLNALEYSENRIFDRKELNYDAGVAYHMNNDLMLDFSLGKINNFGGDSWYINAGVSFRFGGGE